MLNAKLLSCPVALFLFALSAMPAQAQISDLSQSVSFQKITSIQVFSPKAPAYRLVGTLANGSIVQVDGRFIGGLETNCIDFAATARASALKLTYTFRGDLNGQTNNPTTGITTYMYRVVETTGCTLK